MRVVTRIEEVRQAVAEARRAGRTIGFVPTMGYLHEGHLSLVRVARERGAFSVLSIFVNPAQFGPGEDLETYPRDVARDRELARREGVELVFAPDAAEIYPEGFRTEVRVTGLAEPLCGRGRPGHFDGVALVVAKLLNIVQPDFTVFGRKDAQQALLVRRLAHDLHLPGEIVLAPTIREDDGLAMSSRNVRLSPEERQAAAALSRGLFAAALAYRDGERHGERLVALAREPIDREELLEAEYVEIREIGELGPWTDPAQPALLALAVRVGSVRLIDNVWLGGEDG